MLKGDSFFINHFSLSFKLIFGDLVLPSHCYIFLTPSSLPVTAFFIIVKEHNFI